MKKLSILMLGAWIGLSVPVYASGFVKKKRSFECQSDKQLSEMRSFRSLKNVPEYEATVIDIDGKMVDFVAKKNVLRLGKIRTQVLTSEDAIIDESNGYLTIQGNEWALAIAPEKKRASLYNMNPDINEIPMFCLSL